MLRVPSASHRADAKLWTRRQTVDPQISSEFTCGARNAESAVVRRAGRSRQGQAERISKL
ncbi:hypothetical protein AYO39_00485 [Actinobacteria bacterium SCGC AG-212-D09]|nr:hypothetical protein AYO39_00485 [Actinobacteria bacterium SCGC AG-212-D09]